MCALRELTTLDGPVLPGLYDDDPGLIAALACQCFINEYAFAETAEETALVAGLAERRLKGSGLAPAEVVLAMYRPLYGLPGREGLAEQSDHLAPALAALVRQQLLEPLAEGEIARDLPRLTPIEDAVSGAVRDQYEANPYPRWLSTGTKAARPLGKVVAALFPHIERAPCRARPDARADRWLWHRQARCLRRNALQRRADPGNRPQSGLARLWGPQSTRGGALECALRRGRRAGVGQPG